MKEFIASKGADLSTGLRRWASDVTGLERCRNARPWHGVLREVENLESPFVGTSVSWPFPQVFNLGSGKFLLQKDAIYKVNQDWTLTKLCDADGTGTGWTVADFGAFTMFSDGVFTYYGSPGGLYQKGPGNSSIPHFSAVCEFEGRVAGASGNFLHWSRVGAADFEIDETGSAGKILMPFGGNILNLKRLGASLMVYGEDGICKVMHNLDPTPTLSRLSNLDFGLISPMACGGNNNVHVFVDSSGGLWRATPDQIKLLGYYEFFSEMVGEDVVVVFNPLTQEFYISDGFSSYVLTRWGLGETKQAITGGFPSDSQAGFVVMKSETAIGDKVSIISSIIRQSLGGMQTITNLAAYVDGPEFVELGVLSRSGQNQEFRGPSLVKSSPSGWAHCSVSGTEFKLKIEFSASSFSFRDLFYGVKFTDRHQIRGAYAAGQASSQPSE